MIADKLRRKLSTIPDECKVLIETPDGLKDVDFEFKLLSRLDNSWSSEYIRGCSEVCLVIKEQK